MTVHNHGPDEHAGLACREFLVNGELKGECITGPYGRHSGALRDRITTAILNAVYDPLCASAARSAADAILAIPGIAVVELPESDYGPDGGGQFGWNTATSTITATPGEDGSWSVWDSDMQMDPQDARDLAAALLAAADYAERDQ